MSAVVNATPLIDERLGRRVAHALHLPYEGNLGRPLGRTFSGLLSAATCRASVRRLTDAGIRLRPSSSTGLQ